MLQPLGYVGGLSVLLESYSFERCVTLAHLGLLRKAFRPHLFVDFSEPIRADVLAILRLANSLRSSAGLYGNKSLLKALYVVTVSQA